MGRREAQEGAVHVGVYVHPLLLIPSLMLQERALRAQKANGQTSKRGNPVQEARVPQLKELAQKSLLPISRKLMGLQRPKGEAIDKEITTSNQVEALIREATNPANLVSCIVGFVWVALTLCVGYDVRGMGGLDVGCCAHVGNFLFYFPYVCNNLVHDTNVLRIERVPHVG